MSPAEGRYRGQQMLGIPTSTSVGSLVDTGRNDSRLRYRHVVSSKLEAD